jgi:copper ion binding protein
MEYAIDVKGMHCESCIKQIESKIGSLNGIEKIKASLIENKVFVDFNPKIISMEKIKSEIKNLGYSADNDSKEVSKKKTGVWQGIAYGIMPHTACIAFVVGSVLGVTFLTQFFKPLLLNPYFFHILIVISLGFATVSSILYLRNNGLLSSAGAKRKWKYLSTMYGSTIGVNLLLFLIIFPLLANVSIASQPVTSSAGTNSLDLSSMKLSVDITCSGHAPLITQELKTINGVEDIKFSLPNIFDVKYDSAKTTQQQITSLDVFKTYKVTVLSDSNSQTSLS